MPLVVLHVLAAPDGTTGFFDLMKTSAPREVTLFPFSWKRALVGRYDVLHIHWPEYLLRGSSLPRTVLKRFLTVALLARVTLLRTPVVRTVHNVSPHEGSSGIETLLMIGLHRATRASIALNPVTPLDPMIPTRVIPHPHYRGTDVFDRRAENVVRPSLLYFGLIRDYKGLDELMVAYSELDDDGVPLHIMGFAQDPELRSRLESFEHAHDHVTTTFGYVSDDVLGHAVASASHVVLPYRQMHNSGALLLALSVGTRVIAPRTQTTVLIQEEVGPRWLYLFDGERIAGTDLSMAINAQDMAARDDYPVFNGRDPSDVGQAHLEVYRTVCRRTALDDASVDEGFHQ